MVCTRGADGRSISARAIDREKFDGVKQPGQFVISLDFELHWGVRDHTSVDAYRDNLLGVRQVVPALLARFKQRQVHATWATVGLLFAKSKAEALRHAPTSRPSYRNAALDPYGELDRAGATEVEDPFHFAGSLVEQIHAAPNQELATHTFSHFYCLEAGPTVSDFSADIDAAKAIGAPFGAVTKSIVFPRNQYSDEHLTALAKAGTVAFRGNPDSWLWKSGASEDQTRPRRALRLVDSYAGPSRQARVTRHPSGVVDVPGTRFLRPWTPTFAKLEPLKRLRLKQEMTHAARTGGLFHLWWHPHNFGRYLRQNLELLDEVLDVFDSARSRYGMQSLTMLEAAALA